MQSRVNLKTSSAAVLLSSLISTQAFAAGFEKVVMFSGEHAGVANAVTSSVRDAESLYFNPAGLGGSKGLQVDLNFSPTFSQFKGPAVTANTIVEGETTFSPVYGGFISYGIGDKLGIGIGSFISGGTKARFEGLNLGIPTIEVTPNAISELSIMEHSIGVGYEVLPGLRFGAAWRILMVRGHLATPSVTPVAGGNFVVSAIDLDNLSDTRFNGFRVGAQFNGVDDTWGVGFNWRTAVKFLAKGDLTATLESTNAATGVPTSPTAVNGGEGTVNNEFPHQVAFGAFVDIMPKKLRLLGEYVFTQYMENQVLDLGGQIGTTALTDLTLDWRNQHNLKFGVQYNLSEMLTLRGGYAFTSRVTQPNLARVTFASPGPGHTFTLGVGANVTDAFAVNVAGEYSHASGDGEAPATLGEYSSTGYTAHIGVSYRL